MDFISAMPALWPSLVMTDGRMHLNDVPVPMIG